jgi:hypothetical protein
MLDLPELQKNNVMKLVPSWAVTLLTGISVNINMERNISLTFQRPVVKATWEIYYNMKEKLLSCFLLEGQQQTNFGLIRVNPVILF